MEQLDGLRFGEVAGDYDRVRLSYPPVLIDEVIAYAGGDGPGLRALEVGAGTGKATAAFAERGVAVVAVEPDPRMAAILVARGLANVRVEVATFEQYQAEPGFGLLYTADAWHWTAPETRWSLAAGALADGGALALLGHNDRIADAGLRQAVFHELPETFVVRDEPVADDQLLTRWPGDELVAQPAFVDVQTVVHRWSTTITGPDYLAYLMTRAQVRRLSPTQREHLSARLIPVLGATLPLAVDTVAYLARRR
jgi:SAM-dependent methyltransferase